MHFVGETVPRWSAEGHFYGGETPERQEHTCCCCTVAERVEVFQKGLSLERCSSLLSLKVHQGLEDHEKMPESFACCDAIQILRHRAETMRLKLT